MNNKIVLNKHGLIEFFISFLAFNLAFGSLTLDSLQKAINVVGIAISLFISLILFQKSSSNRQKIGIWLLLFLFLGGALYSTYLNSPNHTKINGWQAGTYYILRIAAFFVYAVYIVEIGDDKKFAKNLFIISLIYCVLNDALLIPRIATLRVTQGYLLNGKFIVSYTHLEAVAFYIFQGDLNNKTSKKITIALILYTLIISLLVDCITGVTGTLLLAIFVFLFPKKITKKPLLWIAISIASFMSVHNYGYIVETKVYQNFFIGSLGRSTTLTGRINIYKKLPFLMSGHWLWGYGPSSSNEVIDSYLSMPNTQNGFWDIILQVGVIPFVFLAILTIYAIHQADKRKQNFLVPIIAMLDVYSLLAMVEITISLSFIGLVILVAIYSNTRGAT